MGTRRYIYGKVAGFEDKTTNPRRCCIAVGPNWLRCIFVAGHFVNQCDQSSKHGWAVMDQAINITNSAFRNSNSTLSLGAVPYNQATHLAHPSPNSSLIMHSEELSLPPCTSVQPFALAETARFNTQIEL